MTRKKITYKIFEHISDVDISEQDILDYDPIVLDQLLIDHTMSAKARAEAKDSSKVVNIFWATSDYESAIKDEDGNPILEGFRYNDEIKPENITGRHRRVVMPRVLKDKQLQVARSKDKAEVFTPSWVCNAQNNLIDEAWFGRKDVFNREVVNEDGVHSWIPTEGKIVFPEGDKQKTWKKYVTENRMEITCGEAPYLVSRYDTTTGEPIPLSHRIGLLDRKLRVIGENVETTGEWLEMARRAFMSVYGYEWQGDNLLLAREALLYTFIEYYIDRFNEKDEQGKVILNNVPENKSIVGIARIISWNLWQMDGLKMVVPNSCHETVEITRARKGLFDDEIVETRHTKPCPGCVKDEMFNHNGVYCLIRDWNKKKPEGWHPQPGEDPKSSPWQKIKFSTLLYLHQEDTEDE